MHINQILIAKNEDFGDLFVQLLKSCEFDAIAVVWNYATMFIIAAAALNIASLLSLQRARIQQTD